MTTRRILFALTPIVLVLIKVVFFPGSVPGAVEVPEIAPGAAREGLRSGGAVAIDIRTEEEYRKRRIPGSVLVPFATEAPFVAAVREMVPDPDTVVYVYGRKHQNSKTAAGYLILGGYRQVYSLGGIFDWPYDFAAGD